MSVETRSSSALFKRVEQLKRWEESDTNRESASPKPKARKVKFSSGCVFLAACAAGDKDEVLRLLEKGADINTSNVDGLTALHQACIDDNLDMVEFLVENGADVNRGDNEGWTPLHATASCGFLSIAKYLLENGANVAAVNNDGELPIDIAECEEMEDLLQAEIEEKGIDCNTARLEEERLMLKDARDWLASKSPQVDTPHPKTGATALHVASAKGYIKVMKLLLQCGADVDKQDIDGWSPLHAAAHWGQKEAAQLLAENLADMDSKNFVGQTPFDVADTDMFRFLDDLKKRQNKEEVLQKRQAKKRSELDDKTETETPLKVKKVEVAIEEDVTVKNNTNAVVGHDVGVMDVSSESDDSKSESGSSSSENDSESDTSRASSCDEEKKNMVNSLNKQKDNNMISSNNTEALMGPPAAPPPPPVPPKQVVDVTKEDNNVPTWRKPPPSKPPPLVVTKPETIAAKTPSFKDKSAAEITNDSDVTLRRTNSFQNDPEFYTRYQALRARIQASSYPSHTSLPYDSHSKYIIAPSNKNRQQNSIQDKEETVSVSGTSTVNSVTTSTSSTPTSNSLSPSSSPSPNSQPVRSGLKLPLGSNAQPSVASTTNCTSTSAIAPSSSPGGNRLTIIKNFFKSFVPPVRDEESETQRKAHAKRVRETRRSTQGVTLEEIKSAEQLVKNKNKPTTNVNNGNEQPIGNGKGETTNNNGLSVTAIITTAAPTVPTSRPLEETTQQTVHERRPSWRLRVDNGSKFKLEDATKDDEPPTVPSFLRRPVTSSAPLPRPASAPVETAETTITLPLRRPKSQDDKEQDKENDARNAQATLATQAAIQRRRRPKRRSTGVVAFDNLDDLDPSKENIGGGGDVQENVIVNNDNSGTEKSNRSSRLGSACDLVLRDENGEIDYKRLYEQTLAENDRLKDKLKKTDEELKDTKQTLEKINTVTSKNSLSELEKRERRAMERKLSEMEEELKQLQKLKAENERLRAENRALTRVVSKLTNSAKK